MRRHSAEFIRSNASAATRQEFFNKPRRTARRQRIQTVRSDVGLGIDWVAFTAFANIEIHHWPSTSHPRERFSPVVEFYIRCKELEVGPVGQVREPFASIGLIH